MRSRGRGVNRPVAIMMIGREPGIDVVMPRKCSIAGPAGLAGPALAAASPAPLRTAATDTAPIAAANVLRIAASLGGGSFAGQHSRLVRRCPDLRHSAPVGGLQQVTDAFC